MTWAIMPSMRDFLITKTHNPWIQLVRYGIVAVIAFAIDFGLLYIFTHYLGIFYLLSATFSFFISLFLNYVLSVRWVFPTDADKRHIQITIFIIIGIVGLVLNLLIIWLCTDIFGIYYLFSKIVAIAIVFFWSFIARRILFTRLSQIEE